MKKIRLFLALGLSALAFGCNKDNATSEVVSDNTTNTTVKELKVAVTLPSKTEAGQQETLEVTFKAEIDNETGELVNKEVSENLLSYFEAKDTEAFEKILKERWEKKNAPKPFEKRGDGETHSSCIKDCRENFVVEGEKQKGFGACRFNCWIDTIIELVG